MNFNLGLSALGITTDFIPNFIAVEGPIGVGKTTLAKQLAETFNAMEYLEEPENNPFLERFYQDRNSYALATQLSFLLDRNRKLESFRNFDLFNQTIIADFLIDKDPVFAETILDAEELELYQLVYEKIAPHFIAPDLVVYLQAPEAKLLEQITKRGIKAEKFIDSEYLLKLAESYRRHFHTYNKSPLLIINVDDIDFYNNQKHYKRIVTEILQHKHGTKYLSSLDFNV